MKVVQKHEVKINVISCAPTSLPEVLSHGQSKSYKFSNETLATGNYGAIVFLSSYSNHIAKAEG